MRAKTGFSASGSLSKCPARSLRSLSEATARRNTSRAAVVSFTSPLTARLIFLRTAISGILAARKLFERIENTLRSVPIPKRRLADRGFCRAVQCGGCGRDNLRSVGADDDVGPHLDCDGTLSILAQRDTWNSERCRLFLNAAG